MKPDKSSIFQELENRYEYIPVGKFEIGSWLGILIITGLLALTAWLSIYTAGIIIALVGLLWFCVKRCISKYSIKQDGEMVSGRVLCITVYIGTELFYFVAGITLFTVDDLMQGYISVWPVAALLLLLNALAVLIGLLWPGRLILLNGRLRERYTNSDPSFKRKFIWGWVLYALVGGSLLALLARIPPRLAIATVLSIATMPLLLALAIAHITFFSMTAITMIKQSL